MKTFKFENKDVKIEIIDNEIWFVADDVVDILGFDNTVEAIKYRVDDEDIKMDNEIYLINESGLYNLICTSKSLISTEFKKWIIFDIVPTIRKNIYKEISENMNKKDDLIKFDDKYITNLEKIIRRDDELLKFMSDIEKLSHKYADLNTKHLIKLLKLLDQYDEFIDSFNFNKGENYEK